MSVSPETPSQSRRPERRAPVRHEQQSRERSGNPPDRSRQPNQRFVWLGCLRAFGVILVLVYHFFPALLPGGFIGVDVFFVFSGFLITSLLVREFMAAGRIGLSAFYLRRLRRIAPAVLACVLLTLPLLLLVSPDYRVQIAQQTAAALSWTTNYYEIAAGSAYADVLLPHPFVHTWTLAIEMQYYLVWGALLFWLLPLTLQRLEDGKRSLARSRRVLLILTGVIALVSYILMQIFLAAAAAAAGATAAGLAAAGHTSASAMAEAAAATDAAATATTAFPDPSAAYFNTLSHIYPLMIGSAAGILAGYPRSKFVWLVERINSRLALALVVVSLAIIALLARLLSFQEPLAFNLGILLTSLCCFVVIVVGRGMQSRLAARPEPRLLSWLAETSYSLYLFHWPLLVVCGAWGQSLAVAVGAELGPVLIQIVNAAALVLTFVCGGLSYRFIEKPFSAGGQGLAVLRGWLSAGAHRLATAGVAVGLVGLCALALFSAPLLSSMDTNLRQGAVTLQKAQLEEAHLALARFDELHANSGAVYIGAGATTQIVRGSVSLIGDSVAILPSSRIAEQSGAQIDAEVGRSMESGVPYILALQANGSLGEYVIVALATNTHGGSFAAARQLCEQIAAGHHLIFVTSHGVGDSDMAAMSTALRTLPDEFDFVSIADWDWAIAPHEDWLAADGYHCNDPQAVELYAQTVLVALEAAKQMPLSKGQ